MSLPEKLLHPQGKIFIFIFISKLVLFFKDPEIERTSHQRFTLIPTIILLCSDENQLLVPLRAALFYESNANVITESFALKLDLQMHESNMQLTMSDGTVIRNLKEVKMTINSRYQAGFSIEITCLVVPTIPSSFPYRNISWKNFESEMQKCFLADPKFNQKCKIDMVLSSELIRNILLSNTQHLSNGACVQETKFGWIVAGTLTDKYPIS